jgi:DNA-binding NarL/FixJ family response regulator
MKLSRVILADDHTLLLEAFRKLLEPRYEVVRTVSDGRALLESAIALMPDAVLVDMAMPLLNGLEAGRQIKKKVPGTKIIYLTMNEDPDLAIEAIRAGATGYLLKKSAANELFYAIEEALQGRQYVTPQVARGIKEAFIRDPRLRERTKTLTPRQREVAQLIAEGKSMKEVAEVLKVTPRTVAFHKYQMMDDLGLKTTADLIRFAIKNRVIAA